MTAEERAIARRLVACRGWRWLPGMLAIGTVAIDGMPCTTDFRVAGIDDDGPATVLSVKMHRKPRVFFGALMVITETITEAYPDLADPLTRLGVLQVVRDALGLPDLTTCREGDGWCLRGIPDDRPELWWSTGKATELEAITAALEAAP